MSGINIEVESSEGGGEILQVVSFRLGQEEYAINILDVQEIIRLVDMTPVPNTPAYVEGVINLRGKVIPIINLRARVGLAAENRTKETRIIVVEVAQSILGFIVDSVEEVLRLPQDSIEPPPTFGGGRSEEFHKGVGRVEGRLLILLSLEMVFGLSSVG